MGAQASKNFKLTISNLPTTMKFRDFLLMLIENGVDGVDDIWWNLPDKSATVAFTAPEYATIAQNRLMFGGEQITMQLVETETEGTTSLGHVDARDLNPNITRGIQVGFLYPKIKMREDDKRWVDSTIQKYSNMRNTKSGVTDQEIVMVIERLTAMKIKLAKQSQEEFEQIEAWMMTMM